MLNFELVKTFRSGKSELEAIDAVGKVVLAFVEDFLILEDARGQFGIFSFLEKKAVGRSLRLWDLCSKVLSAETVDVLLKVLSDGSIVYDQDNPGIRTCSENGWIQSDVKGNTIICFFPTKLHAR